MTRDRRKQLSKDSVKLQSWGEKITGRPRRRWRNLWSRNELQCPKLRSEGELELFMPVLHAARPRWRVVHEDNVQASRRG